MSPRILKQRHDALCAMCRVHIVLGYLLVFAHLFFCAAAILARPSALTGLRFPPTSDGFPQSFDVRGLSLDRAIPSEQQLEPPADRRRVSRKSH
jgi:hypothetical protein